MANQEEGEVPNVDLNAEEYLRPDDVLAELQSLANQGIGLPVLLTVGGNVIAGSLISGHTYFNGVAEKLRDSVVVTDAEGDDDFTDAKNKLADLVKLFGSHYPDPATDEVHDDEPSDVFMVHLHLRDVTLNPGSNSIRLPFWRGRLASVDGWTLGAPA